MVRQGIIAAGLAIAVSGCGTPGPDKQANLSAKTQHEADRFIKEKGAAIAFIASAGKNLLGHPVECGSVRLRRIDGDQQFETVSISTGSGFRLFKGYSAKNPRKDGYKIDFKPIVPGKYIVTGLYCDSGYVQPHRFSSKEMPVAGANTIIVGQNEIVDAGSLHFQADFNGRGFLVSYPADSEYKTNVRKHMPNLAPRVTYKTFTPSFL